ncbi:hypothetical protein VTN77DRAFT_8603 [Rasamsonia byssochlamydoides]|uniref:uncharacterized protein n=1 Tax=Rasamsonia byssochlamydoides TaxID=89139 RepID=UPI00374395AB
MAQADDMPLEMSLSTFVSVPTRVRRLLDSSVLPGAVQTSIIGSVFNADTGAENKLKTAEDHNEAQLPTCCERESNSGDENDTNSRNDTNVISRKRIDRIQVGGKSKKTLGCWTMLLKDLSQ